MIYKNICYINNCNSHFYKTCTNLVTNHNLSYFIQTKILSFYTV